MQLRAEGRVLPTFLPLFYSVRVFAAGELSEDQNAGVWAVEREDIPASIHSQLARRRSVEDQNGFVETVADKAYELPAPEFKAWLEEAIARRPKVVFRRERKVWLAIGEALSGFAANGVVLSDVDLDNWGARFPGGEPVLRDCGYSSVPEGEVFFHARPHEGGVQRPSIRDGETYDPYEDEGGSDS
mgnify:FL=1